MAISYKNFWSLNTDEAVVTGILKDAIGKKNCEILMPLNAQMKDVDLVLMNVESRKTITIQIKGSRTYEPKKGEIRDYGEGSSNWFGLSQEIIINATADYFIFLVYVLVQLPDKGRRILEPHTITIPTERLKQLTQRYKILRGEKYHYSFWVNPVSKGAFDTRDCTEKYYVSEYLDKKGLRALGAALGDAD